jgi:NAD(P)-dependent dehydrogenase (short-subunit alcohol dehydrogenase family)
MPERIVITGASRGLGLELARRHAERGDRVLATCRRPGDAPALADLAAAGPERVKVARLDLADPRSIDEASDAAGAWLGAVDILWSNAGIYPGSPGTGVEQGPIGTLRAADGVEVLATNAVGPILVARAFLPLLKRGARPRLAAMSSGYGSLEDNRGTPYWYGASKAALGMLHRSLAFDPEARGVVVLIVSPGWVQTDMGGANAPTPVSEAVAGLMRVVDGAGPDDNGAFLDWRGRRVPW